MKKIFFIIFILSAAQFVKADVSIVFTPMNNYFFTVDQVWNFNVFNSGKQPLISTIKIEVLKNGNFPVLTLSLAGYTLEKGINIISSGARAGAVPVYSADPVSQSFQATGILQPGSYAICVTIQDVKTKIVGYGCNELQISSFTPPILQSPNDEAAIPLGFPLFTWTPVLPATINNLNYVFSIWPKGKGAGNKVGADLLSLTVDESMLQYQPDYPTLETGKTYSWKVIAYSGDLLLGSSEIWDFTINTNANAKIGSDVDDSYRVIGDQTQNAEYIAESILRISYKNFANDSLLYFNVYPVNEPDSALAGLPEILLTGGINNLDIDLEVLELFVPDQKYTFEILDGNSRRYLLNFTYTEEE